ncbi:MAG: glutathione S-transferase family protein [Rhizobiaceae bacterium]|nr:glutathione S-transferase family protein [Rhizobiaceae bacterium]
MSLVLYYHPLASYCHKVLIPLYENGIDFEPRLVDLSDAESSAELLAAWPVGKFPVIRDTLRNLIVPETSIIIEYLDQHRPGPVRFIPADPDAAREVRLWDRFFDLYVSTPMQKIVGDRLRAADTTDDFGVIEARVNLDGAYDMLEPHLASRTWAGGEDFSMADCSAAPALFYAECVHPFTPSYPAIGAYFDRLMARPSVMRVLDEAKPYFPFFPFRDAIPTRFL